MGYSKWVAHLVFIGKNKKVWWKLVDKQQQSQIAELTNEVIYLNQQLAYSKETIQELNEVIRSKNLRISELFNRLNSVKSISQREVELEFRARALEKQLSYTSICLSDAEAELRTCIHTIQSMNKQLLDDRYEMGVVSAKLNALEYENSKLLNILNSSADISLLRKQLILTIKLVILKKENDRLNKEIQDWIDRYNMRLKASNSIMKELIGGDSVFRAIRDTLDNR